ncbi:hypothetical protein A1Q1_01909 [Trichosporon asahii var. asahii CBS 2479]|uniref:Uncharacterized protein n=1 Tax=Trichosporon asahii var. asahii (strain ATCC 90039 / CBS 2479 / JCM 2466 / KCTC 7840 / NBRC 103889/ NCYC 2677 / UAMH 7654) TaxID=1186058 RepID=J5QTH8_TRIAS|nr:hypothetical protein A1Q1_01909 [Trichosporon asahii var. asahii CBS 2479]EJT48998.1 hypothetical protein A1Q1_01909 [Trichosporon asahii var. asahii CBS 2479]
MTPARPIPKRWKLLAHDAVHWRPPFSPSPKDASAKHSYHPYGRSPPATPTSASNRKAEIKDEVGRRSPSSNSDSSLSSLSPSPEPELPPPQTLHPLSDSAPLYHEQLYWDQSPHELALPTPTSALGLSELPSLAHAALTSYPPYPPTSASLEAEVRLAQLLHASPPEHRNYLTPSPTPSRDEWDPCDAYILWPEEESRPTPRIKHMWTSPMHPPELRFLTLQSGGGYEDGVIYALPTKLLPFFARLQWVTAVPGRRVMLPAQSRFAVQRREAADAINRLLEKDGACAGWHDPVSPACQPPRSALQPFCLLCEVTSIPRRPLSPPFSDLASTSSQPTSNLTRPQQSRLTPSPTASPPTS